MTEEMESTVLQNLMNSENYYSKVYSHLEKGLFQDPNCATIFETIQDLTNTYNKRPNPKEVGLTIKGNNKLNKTLQQTTIGKFKEVLRDPKVENMDFLIDQTQRWVQRIQLSKTIFAAADIIQSDGEFGPIPDMVEKSLNINFDTSIGLSYQDTIEERLEYYKSLEAFTPVGLPALDKVLGGGIRPGSLFMFIGSTHTGKCHHFSENINIYVADEELQNIKNSGVKYENQGLYEEKLNKIKIPIGEYFKHKNLDGIDKINEFYKQDENTFVNTPTGLAPIVSMVKKEKNRVIEIETEDGRISKIAENHIFPQEDCSTIFAKDAEYVMTIDGIKKIIRKDFYSEDYVYDISIPAPHVYFGDNGILHHNTAAKVFTASNLLLKKENVLFITLEMPEKEIAKRIDANLFGTTINDLSELPERELLEKWAKVRDNIGNLVIKEYGAGTFNAMMLKSLLDELKSKKDFIPDAIVVDYLGLMVSARAAKNANSYDALGKVAEDLHAIAKETYSSKGVKGIKMISSSQSGRNSIGNLEAGIENISESLKIAMTADVAIMLINNDQMKEQHQQIWKLVKNRYTGEMPSLMMETNFPRMMYKDFDGGTAYQAVDQVELNTGSLIQPVGTGLDFGRLNF